MSISFWRMGVATEFIKEIMENNIRGALMRLSNNSVKAPSHQIICD